MEIAALVAAHVYENKPKTPKVAKNSNVSTGSKWVKNRTL